MTNFGSVEGRCPRCGAPATCSPSKGWWCTHCRNGLTRADLSAVGARSRVGKQGPEIHESTGK